MIGRAAIDERVREWGLREDVVEKDYVLGWLLWGIAADPELGKSWVFKGGTCLKKCYIETYRFSEDLDFTVLPDGPVRPDEVAPALVRVLERVTDESGIDFSVMEPRFRSRRSEGSTEGRVYYRGPRAAPGAASVKLDLTRDEVLARGTVMRPIAHPYDDALPAPAEVRCYSFEELFAEKLRAMGERSRPRDLYDIVNLYRRPDLRLRGEEIRAALIEKCESKGVSVPSFASIEASEFIVELESEWENMLGHQLPALPPFGQFWGELAALFDWLEGRAVEEPLEPMAAGRDEDRAWTPPPTATMWRVGVPLEEIRFAAVNRLCVELGYQGSTRVIEPYSLRRTRDGNLVLHALRADTQEHRSYRVDRIQSARATNRPFTPAYAIEFSSAGPLSAPPTTRRPSVSRRPRRTRSTASGPTYVVECPLCGKHFRRKRPGTRLNPHKDKHGYRCSGRSGYQVDVRW
ncbi:MAG: nucleotidyl transferase AbiEii/AbiGii toxin family protein [Thermoleophilaceae bacterium]